MASDKDITGLVAIGKITGSHGIRGEVKLKPYGDFAAAGRKAVYITRGSQASAAVITGLKPYKEGFIVSFEGYLNRSQADSLAGAFVSVAKAGLPELAEDEYYVHDLIGMEVSTHDGKLLGCIIEVIPTGEVDVLTVKGEYGEVLIPATKEADIIVDRKAGKIKLNLMEGLLGINGKTGRAVK